MPTYTLFVGGIGPKASLSEIEAEFMTFGRCICSFKGNFGFVEFEDRKQAKDAMLHIHGMKFNGERLGVDWKKQKTGGSEGDAWAPERRRAGGVTARPIASEYYRRSNRERDRDRSRDRGSYRPHRDRDSRDGREASRRRGGGFISRSRERDRERYDRERRSRSWDRRGKDWDRYSRGYPSRSRGRDRDSMGARRKNDRSRSRSRSRSRDRRRHESVQSRRTRERGKSPGRREIRSHERRDRRAERDGSRGSSGHRSPAVDERTAETTGVVSQYRRDTRERGSGSQREGFGDERGTDDTVQRSRKRSRSRSRSRILNGDGRSSDESSRGVHGYQEKNGGGDEVRVEGKGGDADEGDDVAMPQTSSDEGDEPRDDSEAALHTDHSEALHTGSENDDDQDKDDEPRMTGEAMESMTLSELRKELKLRNLNFSGKRPALTKRLLAAMDI